MILRRWPNGAERRIAVGALVAALIATGLTGLLAAEPAAAATVNTATIDCSNGSADYTLGTALQANDTLNVKFTRCNLYRVSWTDTSFTQTSPHDVNGNNDETYALTAQAGFTAAAGVTLVTLTEKAPGTKVFHVKQGTVATPVTKVTICHRTRATTNPYVMITVSVNSVIGSGGSNGHDDHNTTRTNKVNPTTNGISPGSGPFDTSFTYLANKKWWGDIIPPFAYDGGYYGGLNWGPTWNTPDPSPGTSTWLQPSEFAAAVTETSSVYGRAVQQCMDIPGGAQSTKSAQIDSPQKYFDVAISNGEDSDSTREDLVDQQALSMGDATPTDTTITVPSTSTLETEYNNTATVTTDPATSVGSTSGKLNGILKSGKTWDSWKYQWGTSPSEVTDGTGSSYTYNSGTDPSSSVGPGATNPEHVASGLACGTTYYFRVVGTYTDSGTKTAYGLLKSFTTPACGGGGGGAGGGGGGQSDPTPGPKPSPSPSGPAAPRPGDGRQPTNLGPQVNPTPGPSSSNEPVATGNGRVVLNPARVLTPPPGTTWQPDSTRLLDPNTGDPKTAVSTSQGTWRVDRKSGAVTFKPSPRFIGTVRMRVALTGRNGQLYIRPMDFRVNAKSRVRVLAGDVPTSINGGL